MILFRSNTSMPRWMLAKKLGPAKKAWKSFTNKLQSKLHKLNIPKTIESTTRRLSDLRSKFYFLIPFKLRALTTKTSSAFPRNQYYNHHYDVFQSHIGNALGRSSYQYHNKLHHNKTSAAAIHIDGLFAEPEAVYEHRKNQHLGAQAETSKGKQALGDDDEGNEVVARKKKSLYSVEDAWQEVVAKSPQLRVVDERAEEFICKFRQEMRLQKEKSLLEFQEMLARGT